MTDNNGNIEHMAELVEKVLSALNDETYEDGMKALDISKSFLEYQILKMTFEEVTKEIYKKK